MNILGTVVGTTDLAILVYFLVLNSFYALLLILSIPEIWEQTRLAEDEDFQRLMQSDALPPITILVPAYNESATIEASVTAILTLEYRNYEVVVVNDGSKDDTLEQLRHAFDLYEIPRVYPETIATKPLRALYRSRTRTRLLVLDKENGGKADSLNAAINASRFPLVIAVDADTLIEPDALLRLTRPFLLGRHIAAVGGTVRVANGCTVKDGRVTDARVPGRFLPGVQVVEYLRAFLFGRLGWNRLGGSLVISGAFGLFRKEYLHAIGGYRTASVVEDLDLVVRPHRPLREHKARYGIAFIPDPLAWGYGMLLSLWAVVLEEVSFQRYRRFGDLGRLLLFATLENFGYRQRTVWWRVQAFWSVFRQKQAWGEMTRKGFESAGKQAIEPATTRRTDAQR